MGRISVSRVVTISLVAVVAAAGWFLLGPAELGGPARYAIIDGTSMSPSLVDGDLAIVRAGGEADVGKVALYRHPRLGVDVLHRIVRANGERFVLKGDNNDYLDEIRPTAEELGGTLWFSVPRVGSAIEWAQQPLHAAIVVFVLAGLALAGGGGAARRRTRPRHAFAITAPGTYFDGALRGLLTAALIATCLFGLLALAAFSRSPVRNEKVDEARVHRGTLSYGATVTPSDVYPDGVVRSGETAFLQLVPALDVAFAYRFSADEPSAVHGESSISAVVSDGAGWLRTFQVADPQPFTGQSVTTEGTLDLEELSAIVAEMKSLTGAITTTFSVRLEPTVEVSGRDGAKAFSDTFTSQVPFLLDDVSLRVDVGDGTTPALSAQQAETGTVEVPTSLGLGPVSLAVEQARRYSAVGLVIALFLLALAAVVVSGRRRDSEHVRIASLLGDRLISIARPPDLRSRVVTDLADLEGLVRISELHDRVVLEWRNGAEHVYFVDDGSTAYRFRTGPTSLPTRSPDLEDTLVQPG